MIRNLGAIAKVGVLLVALSLSSACLGAEEEEGSLNRSFAFIQGSATALAQRLVRLRIHHLDVSPYADAAVRPLRQLGVLSELQPLVSIDLARDVTFDFCLGTKTSAASVGLKITL